RPAPHRRGSGRLEARPGRGRAGHSSAASGVYRTGVLVMKRAVMGIAVLLAAGPMSAQGLPTYVSINPILRARSGLYFQPYVDQAPRWQFRILTDYASTVELSERPSAKILLDSELLRVDGTVLRNIGGGFVGATASFVGAYDGFLDGFLDWYHNLT